MHKFEIQTTAHARALTLSASGTMDAEGLRDAWRETVRAVLRGDGTRVLWDLTGASVEMSAQDWARLAADDGPRAMFSVPVGILVLEKHLRDVYAYADALNCHGKICLGFDRRQDAQAWLLSTGVLDRGDGTLPCRLAP
jgi:hypothetical protein